MNDANHRPIDDVLERATGALRDASTPADPPADLIAATVAAIDNRFVGASPSELARQQRRSRTMRLLRYGSLTTAAAVLLAGAALLFFGNGSAEAFALRPVADKAKQAESVTFVQKQKIGDQSETEMKVFMRGSLVRSEIGGFNVIIADTKTRSGIMLFPPAKAYEKIGKGGRGSVGSPAGKSPIDFLLALRDRKPESTVDEELDGKRVKKITVKGDAKADARGDWIIWVDPKTELPVKIAHKCTTIAGDKELPETNVYEDFVWNAKLDDKLFDMKPPAGYSEGMPGRKSDKK